MRTVKGAVVLLTLLACLMAGVGWAQSTFATITGVVQDASGAVVPNAVVELTNVQRNYKYDGTANEAGQYTFANLPDGTYVLVVKAAGFQEFKVADIIVTGRDIRRVDASLTVGQTSTVVEVSGGATLIETETARIAVTKDREVLRAMPLMLRRAWDYFTMTPQMERTNGYNVRLAGSGELQGTATMDGVTLDTAFASPIGPMMDRTELVQEMRVDIAQANAESATMGQVSLISRSGTNDLHGTAALYYSNNRLNSRDPFRLTKNRGSGYQWIFGVGGPVYIPKIYNGKDKTFFFANVEIATGPVSPYTVQRSVPLQAWRSGDFSALGTVLRDPFNNGVPFPQNKITNINAAAKKYQDLLIPDQNNGSLTTFATTVPTYLKTYPGNPFVHQPTISYRVDHRVSERQFFYGRWTSVRWNFSAPSANFRELTPKSYYKRNMDQIMGAHTYSITPTLLNEFSYGLATQRNPNVGVWDGMDVVSKVGLTGLAPGIDTGIKGLPSISFSSSGVSGVSDQAACNPCGQYYTHAITDNVSWFHGTHSFKFGTNLRLSTYQNKAQNGALFSSSTFRGSYTGFDYADFLVGLPGTLSRAFPAVEQDQQRWTQGFFFQDTWKVDTRLTLTLGLRWDAQRPWTERNNRIAMFDLKTGKIVVPDAAMNLVSKLMPTGYVDVVSASSAGFPTRALIHPDLNNWQPRFGFAYRPWGNATVFRGGFGIGNNQAPQGTSTASIPYIINEPAYTNAATNPIAWPVVFPTVGGGGPTTVTIPNAINPNLQIARMIQYSLTIEHQKWDTGFMLSYNGTGTRQGVWAQNINQPVADTRLFINKARLFPAYPAINYLQNGGGHQYHGLTLQAMRKMKKGFYYQTYFTWAKDILDVENGGAPEDAYNRLREQGPYPRQPKLRLSGNTVYELPVGHGRRYMSSANRWVNGVLGGWRISTIVAIETGRPLTATWTGPDPTGTRFTSNSTPAIVTIRADALRNPNISNPTQYGWFDVNAFSAPQPGRFGTGANGVVVGPPTRVMHNAIAKEFPIKERARARFEILASNSLNHPNWGDPQMNITNAARGLILATTDLNSKFDMGIPRNIQIHLRVEW